MKKTLILTAIILTSCGSFQKQVDKQSKESEISKELETNKEVESTTETTESGSKSTQIDYKANSFIYTPFDATTPYFVDGKEYRNVVIQSKDETSKTQSNEVYENVINEYKKELESLRQLYENSQKETDKKVNTEYSNTWLMLGIAFLFFIIILIILWYFKNQLTLK